jgi:hypothetical protein
MHNVATQTGKKLNSSLDPAAHDIYAWQFSTFFLDFNSHLNLSIYIFNIFFMMVNGRSEHVHQKGGISKQKFKGAAVLPSGTSTGRKTGFRPAP